MTPYPVEWTTTAEDQLADIWLHAPDPSKVTSAYYEVHAAPASVEVSAVAFTP